MPTEMTSCLSAKGPSSPMSVDRMEDGETKIDDKNSIDHNDFNDGDDCDGFHCTESSDRKSTGKYKTTI